MNDEHKQKFQETIKWLEREYAGIRTGQAAPALLDSVKVESYGTMVPIPQIGSVGVEDARTLRISPWDAGQIAAIERAIRDADLGVSVATDSTGLRVIFPELTSERREQLRKLAKAKLEEARVSVRSLRDELMRGLDRSEKAGEISEDELHRQKEQVQKEVDVTNKSLEAHLAAKEDELQR